MAPDERQPPPAALERRKEEQNKTPAAVPTKPLLGENDYREIQGLLDKINALKFSEVIIRRNDVTLSLKAAGMTASQAEAAPVAPAETEAAAPALVPTPAPVPETPPAPTAAPQGPTIDTPLTGTFYASSSPGKPPLVKAGDEVDAGTPVCIVEAMKLFNQIKAPYRCRIVRILREHGTAVEKGQPLIEIGKL